MRKSGKCPKCEGHVFWRIERVQQIGDQGVIANLPVGYVRHSGFLADSREGVGSFEVYVCKACGFSELYAVNVGKLTNDPQCGVSTVDRTPKGEGPYR